MLDRKFQYTKDHSEAFYVHIKNWQQQEAFEALQYYEGMGAHIPKPGYWYYDDRADSYVDVEEELNRLREIKQRLNNIGN
jgi:RIO-like serine/threonine protein kinase